MKHRLRNLSLLVLALLLSSVAANPQQSGPYVLERMTASSGAATMTSASYVNILSTAQDTPIGASSVCGGADLSSFGFWSVVGDLAVPIMLQVRQNPTDPNSLDLTWTGAAAQFQVCRDFAPQNLCATPYAFSFVCGYTDTRGSDSSLIFYGVIPKP